MLSDRHDWLSSTSGELVITLAVEQAMGLVPPARATWLRTLLLELARIHSHLSYLSHLSSQVWSAVEAVRQAMVEASGNRIHPMLARVGGLATDVEAHWLSGIEAVVSSAEIAAEHAQIALDAERDRFVGLAVANPDCVRQFGLTGPVARACGIDLDLRASGALAWGQVYQPIPCHSSGDAAARFQILIDEVGASATMARRLIAGLPDGPVDTRLARRLKVPEGQHTADLEAPWGVTSALLVSRGGQTPWRVALRTPTFHNVAALECLLIGLEMHQVPDAIASMGYAVGDLDK